MDKMWTCDAHVSSTGPEALRRFTFLDMTVRTLTWRLNQEKGKSHPECAYDLPRCANSAAYSCHAFPVMTVCSLSN